MQKRSSWWAKKIKDRDGEACLRCGFDRNLETHHIMPVDVYPEYIREDINGLTLCRNCHSKLKGKELTTNLLEFIEEHPDFHNRQNTESQKARIVEQLTGLLWHATAVLSVLDLSGDEMVKRAKRHTPDTDALEKYQIGQDYLGDGGNDRAIEYFTEALDLDPEYTEAYNAKGVAYHEKGDYEQAIADYYQIIKINLKHFPN